MNMELDYHCLNSASLPFSLGTRPLAERKEGSGHVPTFKLSL